MSTKSAVAVTQGDGGLPLETFTAANQLCVNDLPIHLRSNPGEAVFN
jgi:hypothetical protein